MQDQLTAITKPLIRRISTKRRRFLEMSSSKIPTALCRCELKLTGFKLAQRASPASAADFFYQDL